MNNSVFSDLIENLNVGLVIFVENDFTPIEDPLEILSYLVDINNNDLKFLLLDLQKNGYEKLSEDINCFIGKFKKLPHDIDLKNNLVNNGQIIVYLNKLKNYNEGINSIIDLATSIIKDINIYIEEEKDFLDIFLKYGAVNDLKVYNSFMDSLKSFTNRKSIRIYTNVAPIQWDIINSDIQNTINNTEFCLCIVDKHLGSQNAGLDFIKGCLFELRDKCNIVSVIFTSYFEEIEQKDLLDYYTLQINKEDDAAIKTLTEGLAFCAYLFFFERLFKLHKDSLMEAYNLAVKRRNNINYIASMAHDEGITAFEAINKWFELVKEEAITEKLMSSNNSTKQEYNFIAGLTYFLNDRYLSDKDKEIDMDTEENIQRLNTFEIFDYTINNQNLPPTPGDVFEYKDGFLVLIGQDCDSVLRGKSLSRKSKSAELVYAKYTQEFIDKKVDSDEMIFQYFQTADGQIGNLEINIEKRFYADYHVLDICTFNRNGSCILNLSQGLDIDIKKVIPDIWKNYYKKLQDSLSDIIKINSIIESNVIIRNTLSSYDISCFEYKLENNSIIYPLRRICRIKGKFKDLLVKKFWDYRSRIGIDTIPLTNTSPIHLSLLQYGYPGNFYTKNVELQAFLLKTNNREKNKYISKLEMLVNFDDLVDKIRDNFEIPTHLNGELITIKNGFYEDSISRIKIEKIIKDNVIIGIKITFPYINLYNNDRILDDEIKISKLIKSNELIKNTNWFYTDKNSERVDIYDSESKPKKFKISDVLSRGIYNSEVNVKIKLSDNGKIVFEHESFAAATKEESN
jgi:hypothetical protein